VQRLLTAPDMPARLSGRLTVAELAADLDIPVSTAYRWLERGLIPGAQKVDPHSPRSGWWIPADAPARFRAGERGS
jgi:hypothetical protein